MTTRPEAVAITDDEIDYLCRAVSRYLAEPVRPEQVIWTYAGVRPLFDDANKDVSAVTRDYAFDLDAPAGDAPLLSVFGGKITTYRKLAEHALARLQPVLGFAPGAWTAAAPLPGGDLPDADFEGFLADLQVERPWLPRGARPALRSRLRHPGGERCSTARRASPISASPWATASTRPRPTIWCATSGRAPPRTSCSAAPSSASTSTTPPPSASAPGSGRDAAGASAAPPPESLPTDAGSE